MHLIIFDVDGTLTHSSRLDTDCYCRAVLECSGITIDSDWSQYRHQTDAAILSEALERVGRRDSPLLHERVKTRFVSLLREAYKADPSCCVEVPGARAILENLLKTRNARVGIATGGWEESARLKLVFAGFGLQRIPFASADDAPGREQILEVAIRRAIAEIGSDPGTITYVGDAPWDVAAASRTGIRFVGRAEGNLERVALRSAGAEVIISDFTEPDAFSKLMEFWSQTGRSSLDKAGDPG